MHAKTLEEVVTPYLNLPTTIQTALIRVETHPTFRSITKSALLVLKAFVSRASATNGAAIILARVDRVATEAGVSTKSVQRALRAFERLDWVAPASEGRSEWGLFESRRYRLSPALCELVQLPTKGKTVQPPPGRTALSDGPIYVDLNLKKDLREISIKAQEGQGPTLPELVRHLPEQTGILPTGICKLLGIANREGHQLADVVEVAKPYLAKIGASPARAYRYLLAMLLNPKKVDYTGKLAQEARIRAATAATATVRDIEARCRFKKFTHVSNGMQVRFFDGSAEVRVNGEYAVYAGEQMAGLYRGVANGKLREVVE